MSRVAALQSQLQARKATLRQREERLRLERTTVLQAEADLVELSKEAEVKARVVAERQHSLEARLSNVAEREREADDVARTNLAQHHRDADAHEKLQMEIEARWRRLEEQIAGHDAHVASERERLRLALSDVDARDAVLREKQRLLADREAAAASRQRSLTFRAASLVEMDRTALERKRSELAQREAFLQQEMAAASTSPAVPR